MQNLRAGSDSASFLGHPVLPDMLREGGDPHHVKPNQEGTPTHFKLKTTLYPISWIYRNVFIYPGPNR